MELKRMEGSQPLPSTVLATDTRMSHVSGSGTQSSNKTDLETRLRGMILSGSSPAPTLKVSSSKNGLNAQEGSPKDHGQQQAPASRGRGRGRAGKRLNQSERRKLTSQVDISSLPQSGPPRQIQTEPKNPSTPQRGNYRGQREPTTPQTPMIRYQNHIPPMRSPDFPPPSSEPESAASTMSSDDRPYLKDRHQHQAANPATATATIHNYSQVNHFRPQSQQYRQNSQPWNSTANEYRRPNTHVNRGLFDPNGGSSYQASNARGNQMNGFNLPPLQMSLQYIHNLAVMEIQKVKVEESDLREKEAMRKTIERLCRHAVSEHEKLTNAEFEPMTISLTCFGSLSSGFAVVGSDMDLTFISPLSNPDSASAVSPIPRILERALLDAGYGARLLTRTRVPIVKFCEIPSAELQTALLEERSKWEREEKETAAKNERLTTKKDNRTGRNSKSRDGSINSDKSQKPRKKNHGSTQKGKTEPAEQKSEQEIGPNSADHGQITAVADENASMIESQPNASAGLLTNHDCADEGTFNSALPQSHGKTDDQASETASVSPSLDRNNPKSPDPLTSRLDGTLDNHETDDSNNSSKTAVMRGADEECRLYKLAIKEGWFDQKERTIINRFIDAFESKKGDAQELLLAREALKELPNVLSRYRDRKEDLLEFPKTGAGIQCDINFSNLLGIQNTHLLKCYSLCDPRIRLMVLFVKAWAKRRKINTPYKGTLSSYGYVLMVLHYAVNISNPPLAPNLQHSERATPPSPKKPKPEPNLQGYDVRFWRDVKEIQTFAEAKRILPRHNEDDLGTHLRAFFQYYANPGSFNNPNHRGFAWTQDVLSLRTPGGILTKKQKNWVGATTTVIEASAPGQETREVKQRYLFAIEDPFELDHNVARTVIHDGIVKIRDEFRRAFRLIQGAGHDQGRPMELMEEGSELPSQRSQFGPKPRPFIGPPNLAKELRPRDPYGFAKSSTVVKS
ncbi:hypothetical protein MMC25_007533 [Agyrium rufum]|nr:hypothetical protein [Agyrium rufum]